MRLITKDAREQIGKVLSPGELSMLDDLIDGSMVPIDPSTRVRVYRVRQALSALSPLTVVLCARGKGYYMKRISL